MTKQRAFKQMVRERMQKTGESYSSARFHLASADKGGAGTGGGGSAGNGGEREKTGRCTRCKGEAGPGAWARLVEELSGKVPVANLFRLCDSCSSTFGTDEERESFARGVFREFLQHQAAQRDEFGRQMELLRLRFLPCQECGSSAVVSNFRLGLDIVEKRQREQVFVVKCKDCGRTLFEQTRPGGSTNDVPLPPPLQVAPFDGVMVGTCPFRLPGCEAQGEDVGVITAVWAQPDNRQINVCVKCRSTMLERGIWKTEAK